MANRSYLYAVDRLPTEDNRAVKIIGLSEYGYMIPDVFVWLVSFSPQTCVSTIFSTDEQLCVAGDTRAAREAIAERISEHGEGSDEYRLIATLQGFLNRPVLRDLPYLLLEVGEIFDMSSTSMSVQLDELLTSVRATDHSSLPTSMFDLSTACEWTHVLYYEPAGTIRPEFSLDSPRHRDGSDALAAKIHKLRDEFHHITELQLTCDDRTSTETVFETLEQIPRIQTIRLTGLADDNMPQNFEMLRHVTQLNFTSNAITSLPSSLGSLTQLEFLNLNKTGMSQLPDAIRPLAGLKRLLLGCPDLEEIPNWIGDLASLEHLNFADTHVEEIPASIGELGNLRRLEIYGLQIDSLPDSFSNLASLEYLNISRCNFDNFPKVVATLPRLEELIARNNGIDSFPDDVLSVGTLRKLDLSGCGMTRVPERLGHMPNLKILDLSNNQLRSLPSAVRKAEYEKLLLTNTGIKEDRHGFAALETQLGHRADMHRVRKPSSSLQQVTGALTAWLRRK